ncbi:MAG: hypothetical protein ACRCZP_06940 [Phycicoccus sp.]
MRSAGLSARLAELLPVVSPGVLLELAEGDTAGGLSGLLMSDRGRPDERAASLGERQRGVRRLVWDARDVEMAAEMAAGELARRS